MSNRVEELKRVLKDGIDRHDPIDTKSFMEGFVWFADCFSIWRNGERLFGSSEFTMKELASALELFEKDQQP